MPKSFVLPIIGRKQSYIHPPQNQEIPSKGTIPKGKKSSSNHGYFEGLSNRGSGVGSLLRFKRFGSFWARQDLVQFTLCEFQPPRKRVALPQRRCGCNPGGLAILCVTYPLSAWQQFFFEMCGPVGMKTKTTWCTTEWCQCLLWP